MSDEVGAQGGGSWCAPRAPAIRTPPEIVKQVRALRRERARHAVPRARRQGARADARPLPRHRGGPARAGAAGPAPSRADQLLGGVRRHDRRRGAARRGRRRCCRADAHDRMRTRANALAAAPEVLAALANLELVARAAVEGFFHGHAPVAALRLQPGVRRVQARIPKATIRASSTGTCSRAPIAPTSSATMGETNTRLMIALDASASMGYRHPARSRSCVREVPRGGAGLHGDAAARPGRPDRVRFEDPQLPAAVEPHRQPAGVLHALDALAGRQRARTCRSRCASCASTASVAAWSR